MKHLFAAALLVVASTSLCSAQTQTTKPLHIQDQNLAVVSLCQLVSQPDTYLGREMTLLLGAEKWHLSWRAGDNSATR